MTTPPTKTGKKKTVVNSAVIERRRSTVEARILKLEGKLNKDRALLLRYAAQQQKLAEKNGEDASTEENAS